MIWLNKIVCAILLTSVTGSILLLTWYGIGCFLDQAGHISAGYRMLVSIIAFFLIPVSFLALLWLDGTKGIYGGWIFSRTPFLTQLAKCLFGIWGVGCLIRAVGICISVRRRNKRYRDLFPCEERVNQTFAELCADMGISKKKIKLCYSYHAESPFITGIFRPRIVLPPDSYDDAALKVVLTHELTHYKQKDLWYKWGCVFVTCIHWFNPAAWWLSSLLKCWSEYICDYRSVQKVKDAPGYARVIVTMAMKSGNGRGYMESSLFEEHHILLKRVQKIDRYQKMKRKPKFAGAVLCAVMCLFSTATVCAASKGLTDSYMELYDRTKVEVEEKLLQEDTAAAQEGEPAAEAGEATENTGNAAAFSWTISDCAAKKSPVFYAEKGETIAVTAMIDPGDKMASVGIIEPGGSVRYVNGNSEISHTFEVKESGSYQVFVKDANTWIISSSKVIKTLSFYAEKGETIPVVFSTMNVSSDTMVSVGIIEPGGSLRYVNGINRVSHTFVVNESGEYQIIMKDESSLGMKVNGGYSVR